MLAIAETIKKTPEDLVDAYGAQLEDLVSAVSFFLLHGIVR